MAFRSQRKSSAFSVYAQNVENSSFEESPEKDEEIGTLSSRKKTFLKSSNMEVVNSPVPKKRLLETDESNGRASMNRKKHFRNKKIKKNAVAECDNGPENEHSVVDEEKEECMSAASSGNIAAEELFKFIISPMKPSEFFKKKLDNEPLHIERGNPNYYRGIFSTKEFDSIMRQNNLEFHKEIDVVSYVENERREVSDDMKVQPSFIWNAYKEGNSIRMRNPQAYSKKLWNICSLLQEYFSSFVGVNMYLTPAGSQGFPPHYDDIDAFILQIEGKKKWKLYNPRDESEVLARYSSGDMKEDEIGKPFLEVELKAGDLLYFPRGVIHQAMTSSEHSLHLTVSCNQLNTWGDLLQIGFSHAVEQALKQNVEFRKSLPKDYMEFAGALYSDSESKEKSQFIKKFNHLARETLKYLSVDHAVDVHATDFIHGSMPPDLSKTEEEYSIRGNGSCINVDPNTGVEDVLVPSQLTPETKIKWIRKRAFRLVMDDEGVRLFYSLGNSKNHKEEEASFMEMDEDVVPAINMLFKSHPNFVKVKDFPIACSDTKLEVAQQLYDSGFLMTEERLGYEI